MNIKHILFIIACTIASPSNAWTISNYLPRSTRNGAMAAQIFLLSFVVTELFYNSCPEEARHLKTYGQEPQLLHKAWMRIKERKTWLLFACANLAITKHMWDQAIHQEDVAALWNKLYQAQRDLSQYS